MWRAALVIGTIFFFSACGREPCGEPAGGPNVRLDLALGTCNATPVAGIDGPKSGLINIAYDFDGSGSFDVNGDALTYTWKLTPPNGSAASLTSSDGGETSFSADEYGVYELALTVNDGELTSAPAVQTIRVSNAIPVADPGVSFTTTSSAVTLDGSASSDEDGDPLSYSWTIVSQPVGSVTTLDAPTSAQPSMVLDATGSYQLELVVSDGIDDSPRAPLVVGYMVRNLPPVLVPGGPQTVLHGATVQMDASASFDPDGGALQYTWTFEQRPAGSIATFMGENTAIPTFLADVPGAFIATVVASDGQDTTGANVTIDVTARPEGPASFIPEDMYFIGSLKGAGAVVCKIDRSDAPAAAFGQMTTDHVVRPTDGALLYRDTPAAGPHTVREWVRDPLPYDAMQDRYIYPRDGIDNDPIVPTPPCDENNQLSRFLIHPSTGEVYYKCTATEDWFTRTATFGVVRPTCERQGSRLFAIGYDDSMLCRLGLRNAAGEMVSLDEPATTQDHVRAKPDGRGFWVITAGKGAVRERRIFSVTGSVTVSPRFGAAPAHVTAGAPGRFDAFGRFYEVGFDVDRNGYVIRYDGPAPGVVLFPGANPPICQIVGRALVSAP